MQAYDKLLTENDHQSKSQRASNLDRKVLDVLLLSSSPVFFTGGLAT